MAISDFYSTLYYYTPTWTSDGAGGSVKSYPTPVSFQGYISKIPPNKRVEIAGQVGTEISAKLYCPVTVSLSDDAVVKNGSDVYRLVPKQQGFKNSANKDHHYLVYLQAIDAETIL